MKINNAFKLVIAIVVSELAGIIGSVFTTPSITGWYAGIVKPALLILRHGYLVQSGRCYSL